MAFRRHSSAFSACCSLCCSNSLRCHCSPSTLVRKRWMSISFPFGFFNTPRRAPNCWLSVFASSSEARFLARPFRSLTCLCSWSSERCEDV
ncbi:hypothetical protein K469DRAFT_712656 [Zopfia rhizophila CBS 207.26]|uniref:Uncharacterized protein n=1 Tax=Zopfia rhizophila CBS 207.26 TaxID=1314779 RepID=A0A6A6ES51_9PEZI|nr:hypothetical protein K469DRAFT_712656 [Zopfia rhizophila CBS 207.26]